MYLFYAPISIFRKNDSFMRTRNYHVSIWLSASELEHLKKQSQASGLGMDPFIRQLIMGVQLRPRPPDTYAALLRELNAIGNNVNQLAYQANARGEATQDEIHEAVLLVREAVRLVRDTL